MKKDIDHEQTGWRTEMKILLREPPLLFSILAVFALFGFFIIYPFFKLLLVPTAALWSAGLVVEFLGCRLFDY